MPLTQQQLQQGYVAIPGAQYNTSALQQANFNNIFASGGTLYGIPRNQSSYQAPSGYQAINGAQYNTSQLQNQNFSNIYAYGGTLYGIPKIPSTISSGTFGSSTPTPSYPTSQYNPNSYVSQYQTYMNQVMGDYQRQQEEQNRLMTERDTRRNYITDLMRQIGQKGSDYRAELDKLGVNTNFNKLQDLFTQISAKNAGFEKMSVDNQGRAVMNSMIGGQESLIRRQQAVEIGSMTSMAQAIQGNIELAYKTANETINMKYEPLENQLKLEMQQLDYVYEDLNRADKLKADAQKTLLDERLRLIDEQKSKEEQIYNVMIEAAQNGADQNTLQRIMSAQDLGQAIQFAGPTFSDNSMFKSGYSYVSTPAERDRLKKLGYDIKQYGGRTYAAPPKKVGGSGGGKKEEVTFNSALTDTANYLKGLRDSGQLSDLSYRQAINSFISDFGLSKQDYGEVSSNINRIMEGGQPSMSAPTIEADNNPTSDFILSYKEQGLGTYGTNFPTYLDELDKTAGFLNRGIFNAGKKVYKSGKRFLLGK